jgi:pimeloyl-ACP methyl ester carboxylesterase
MAPTRREVLATGAAATAVTAAPQVFAQNAAGGKFFEKGPVRIRYEEVGSGFPLLCIAGGGLNSALTSLHSGPFDPMKEFGNEFHCVGADLRNAIPGQSTGPLDVNRPWDSHTDDQLALMDHIGANKFMVIGFCIGGPFIWNLLKRAPDRVVGAVLAQPVGFRPEMPTVLQDGSLQGWGPDLAKRRSDITMDMIRQYVDNMYTKRADFVFTVDRNFVRNCQTPVLIMPDDIPAHPYKVAMEAAMLAPKSEVSMYPWKDPKERIPIAVRQVHSFLRAHQPLTA